MFSRRRRCFFSTRTHNDFGVDGLFNTWKHVSFSSSKQCFRLSDVFFPIPHMLFEINGEMFSQHLTVFFCLIGVCCCIQVLVNTCKLFLLLVFFQHCPQRKPKRGKQTNKPKKQQTNKPINKQTSQSTSQQTNQPTN